MQRGQFWEKEKKSGTLKCCQPCGERQSPYQETKREEEGRCLLSAAGDSFPLGGGAEGGSFQSELEGKKRVGRVERRKAPAPCTESESEEKAWGIRLGGRKRRGERTLHASRENRSLQ